jgi:hypothetical protein
VNVHVDGAPARFNFLVTFPFGLMAAGDDHREA